jgi:putative oxidoreductase
MFPNGLPGKGLLLLRVVAGALLIHDGFTGMSSGAHAAEIVRQIAEVVTGVFLLVGFWTPIVGAIVLIIQVWIIFAGTDHLAMAIVMATFGAALAMLGPGATSIDAIRFGRKRIDIENQ